MTTIDTSDPHVQAVREATNQAYMDRMAEGVARMLRAGRVARVSLAPGDATEYRVVVVRDVGGLNLRMLNCGERGFWFSQPSFVPDHAILVPEGWHPWTAVVMAMFAGKILAALGDEDLSFPDPTPDGLRMCECQDLGRARPGAKYVCPVCDNAWVVPA